MRRYRMHTGEASGGWRATRELARQDAVRAGYGYRHPATGVAVLGPEVDIEIADGEAPSSESELLEGDALAVLVVHGIDAETFATSQQAHSLTGAECERWRAILEILHRLRAEARRKLAGRSGA